MDREEKIHIDLPSLVFVIWFIVWMVALLILPHDYHNTLFITLGIAPVVGWFLLKPKKRIVWALRALTGVNGLDQR